MERRTKGEQDDGDFVRVKCPFEGLIGLNSSKYIINPSKGEACLKQAMQLDVCICKYIYNIYHFVISCTPSL